MKSILYIFMPCKQIYPLGCTYLADYIHKRHPDITQQILDLSLIPLSDRSRAVRERAEQMRPDLVCFSWRDIQIFSPHEGDASLEQAFNFYYSSNPLTKLKASFSGFSRCTATMRDSPNLSYLWFIEKRVLARRSDRRGSILGRSRRS